MYNVDDIFARLMQGEKLEDIGNELANAMNAAQEKYAAAQKEEEEKKVKALKVERRKQALCDVLNAVMDYADQTEYAGTVRNWVSGVNDEELEKLDIQLLDMLKLVESLQMLNFSVLEPVVEKKTSKKDSDKTLGNFLKMMGW